MNNMFILWLWNWWFYFNLFLMIYIKFYKLILFEIMLDVVFFLVLIGFRKVIIKILDIYFIKMMFYVIIIFLFFVNYDRLCELFI